MKRTHVFILVLIILATINQVAVCSGKNEEAAAQGPVEIRVAWWGDNKRHELYNKIADTFQAENPGITLVREPTSWTDYWDKLTVQSAGGNAPDFMGMHPQFANDYVRRGMLEPLTQYVKDRVIVLDDFSKGAIESGIVVGVNYMIAMGITGQSFMINKNMVEGLGLKVPSMDWTWDDLKTMGLAARKALDALGKKDTWLIDDNARNFQLFRYWVRQNGRELYTASGDIGFTVDDAASWFSYWVDMRKNRIVPDAATSIEYVKATLEESLIAKRKVVIRGVPANQYKLYRTAMPDVEIIKPKLDQYQLKVMEYVGKIAELATVPTIYPPTGASEIDALFQATAEQVQFETRTPQQAAQDLVKAAQAIVEKNRKP